MNLTAKALTCPNKAQWDALLDGVLADDVVNQMESHLANCDVCVSMLEELTPPIGPLLKAAGNESAPELPSAWLWSTWLQTGLADTHTAASTDPYSSYNATFFDPPMMLVGDYQLLSLLGRGGMGLVYRARQVKLNRDVAVKMLPSRTRRSSAANKRLIAEAQRLAHIKHSNIVQVFDVGEQDHVPFFSMELIEGKTLANTNRETPYSPRRAAELVRKIAEAIQAAHDTGIIHRDLKPSNVLLTPHGEPKVTDFGLGTTLEEVFSGAAVGGGTAEYMAPEQWTDDPTMIGVRTDVYGLGTILYELLTGRPPFPRDSDVNKTRNRVLCESPVAPHRVRPQVPRDLEAICLHCLEKSPDRRYRTAQAVADDLGRYQRHYPVIPRHVGMIGQLGYWCRRNSVVLTVAALVLAIAAAVMIPWMHNYRRAAQADGIFENGVRLAKEGRIDDGLDQFQRAIDLLPADRLKEHRYYQQSVAGWKDVMPRNVGLYDHATEITATTVAPEGNQVLFGDDAGAVWLWSPIERRMSNLKPRDGLNRIQTVAFDRTGKRCAASEAPRSSRSVTSDSPRRVWIWNAITGELLSECSLELSCTALTFLGDTDTFVTGSSKMEKPLRLWSAKTKKAELLAPPAAEINDTIVGLSSAPDGNLFAAVSYDGNCWVCDQVGQIIRNLPLQFNDRITLANFSDDGTKLVLAAASKTYNPNFRDSLIVIDLKSAQITHLPSMEPGAVVKSMAIGADGKLTLVIERGSRTIIRNLCSGFMAWEDFPATSARTRTRVHTGLGDETVVLTETGSTKLSLSTLPKMRRRATTIGITTAWTSVTTSENSGHISFLGREIVPEGGKEPPNRVHLQIRDNISLQPLQMRSCTEGDLIPASIAQHPKENLLALGCASTGDQGAAVLFCTPKDHAELEFQQLGKHGAKVWAVTFSPDGRWLFSGCAQVGNTPAGELARWDVARRVRTHFESYPTTVKIIEVSPDGRLLAVGGSDGSVRILPADTLNVAGAPIFDCGSMITALAFSTDGKQLAIGTIKGRVVVCEVDKDQLSKPEELDFPAVRVTALRFGPNSKRLFGASYAANTGITVWNTECWRRIGPPIDVPGAIWNFALDHFRSELVVHTEDGRLVAIQIPNLD